MILNRKLKLGTIIILALFYFNATNGFLDIPTSTRSIRLRTYDSNHRETKDVRRFGENRLRQNDRAKTFDERRSNLKEILNNHRDVPKFDTRESLERRDNRRFSPNRLITSSERQRRLDITRSENRDNLGNSFRRDEYSTFIHADRSRLSSHGNSFARTTSRKLSNQEVKTSNRQRILDQEEPRSSQILDDRRNRLMSNEARQKEISTHRNVIRLNKRVNEERRNYESRFRNRVSERNNGRQSDDRTASTVTNRRTSNDQTSRTFRDDQKADVRRNIFTRNLESQERQRQAFKSQNTVRVDRRNVEGNLDTTRNSRDSRDMVRSIRIGQNVQEDQRRSDKSSNHREATLARVRSQDIPREYRSERNTVRVDRRNVEGNLDTRRNSRDSRDMIRSIRIGQNVQEDQRRSDKFTNHRVATLARVRSQDISREYTSERNGRLERRSVRRTDSQNPKFDERRRNSNNRMDSMVSENRLRIANSRNTERILSSRQSNHRVDLNRRNRLSNRESDRKSLNTNERIHTTTSRRDLGKSESRDRSYRIEHATSHRASSRRENSNTRLEAENNRRLSEERRSTTQRISDERRSRILINESARRHIDNKQSTSERRFDKSDINARISEDSKLRLTKRLLSNEDGITNRITLSERKERIQYHREKSSYADHVDSTTWINIAKVLLLSISIAQIISSSNPKRFRLKSLTNLFVGNKEKVF